MDKLVVTKELIEARIKMDQVNTKRTSKSIILLLQEYYGKAFLDAPLQTIFTKILADFPEIVLTENKLRMIRHRRIKRKEQRSIQENSSQENPKIANRIPVKPTDKPSSNSIIDQIFSKQTN